MPTAGIRSFFEPQSIAVIGATDREHSAAKIVLDNLIKAKDRFRIYPINPNRETLLELKCFPSISNLPEVPDLAIVVINAKFVPDAIEEAGAFGVRSVTVISAGFKEAGDEGKAREEQIGRTAKKYGMRIIGPNCLGTIRPSNNLNATFVDKMTRSGSVAFLSQSGALGSAVLDWAISRDIGFSAFVSLGSMLDVDFGDLIDYLGEDRETRAIIIYLESLGSSLQHARKFMSAARGFARTKPIIVIKPGKFAESRKAAQSHTGAMVGDDIYYEAAFDRAGVVRVEEIQDLFNCASILNTAKLPKKPNLAIVTNAGGPAVLATDSLMASGGKLAECSDQTIAELNKFLPAYWSKCNPIDILGDADVERYMKTIEITVKDSNVNGIVVIFTPQGTANPVELAKAIVKVAKKTSKPILTTIMGSRDVAEARKILYDAGVPTYEFPEEAIRTYLYMYQYAHNLEDLYETPEDLALSTGTPNNHIRILTRNAIKEGRTLLGEDDSKKIISTYGIEATMSRLARTADEAVSIANSTGYPIVMKIASPDITHKSDVGGVALNLGSEKDVKKAFTEMIKRVKEHMPDATIDGVSIQQMVTEYDYEFIVGSKKDDTLGPVILFGLGGTEAEFYKDVAVGLPPLNQNLARRIMERTKTYSSLAKGFRSKKPVDLTLLDETLVKLSNLVVDFPEIKELDINPLVLNAECAMALDARIILDENVVAQDNAINHQHLVISPYPTRYVQPWQCRDGKPVILRPIRPEDEPLEAALLSGLSPESSRFRFFQIIKEITHDMLSRYCNIDYDREMAIIAEYTDDKNKKRNVGVGRLIIESEDTGEFAVLIADDFQDNGLGLKLVDMLIGIGQDKKLKTIYGIVISTNSKMLRLAHRLGFTVEKIAPDQCRVTLDL